MTWQIIAAAWWVRLNPRSVLPVAPIRDLFRKHSDEPIRGLENAFRAARRHFFQGTLRHRHCTERVYGIWEWFINELSRKYMSQPTGLGRVITEVIDKWLTAWSE